MSTYAEAEATLKGRERRKVAWETWLERRSPSSIAVRYHDTDVVTFHDDGLATLDSGGWRTVTTKRRMNEWSGAYVCQRDGVWYVGQSIYADKCQVDCATGALVAYAGHPPMTVGDIQADRKAARKYAREYVKALRAGDVPAPSGGDCWGCLMRTESGERPMGGPDHMRSHMSEDERYYVPSLLVNAFDRFGASIAMRDTVARIWRGDETPNMWGDFIWKDIEKFIRRFVYAELGNSAV